MAERIRIHRENFESRKAQFQRWKFPQSVKAEVLRFLEDLELGKVNRGKKLGRDRQLHYLNGLRIPLEFFNKPMTKLTVADVENFEKALSSGVLRNKCTSQPYSHNTQVEVRKLLKVFLRWRFGAAKALDLAGWLDTRYRTKTPDYLKEAEVEQLFQNCRDARQRFLIAVLFDTGARAEEFHNIRFEDVALPEGKEDFVRIRLRQEYSKTLERTIGLFWQYSTEAVRKYVTQRLAAGARTTDPVFKGDYTATRKFLQRLGQDVLKRPVHYHLFRHSSSTYYATKLNRQELCRRYGWKFSSNMPDVYISRSGMEEKELGEKFTQTELGNLKSDFLKLEQADRLKGARIQELESAVQMLKVDLDTVTAILRQNPPIAQVEAALLRKTSNQRPTRDR
jgi:site-specific recombinase XerD